MKTPESLDIQDLATAYTKIEAAREALKAVDDPQVGEALERLDRGAEEPERIELGAQAVVAEWAGEVRPSTVAGFDPAPAASDLSRSSPRRPAA